MSERVAVIGAGSWGTAVAGLTAANVPTVLWARDAELAAAIDGGGVNPRYLPDHRLPDALRSTASLAEAVADATLVLMAVPSHGFRAVAGGMADALPPARRW